MGRVGASIELPYPPERVFRVATRIEDLPRWLPEVVEATLIDTPLASGSRVHLKLSGAAAGAEVTGSVRQLRPPSILVIGGSGGPLTVEVRTRLDRGGEGAPGIALDSDRATWPRGGASGGEAERRINAELPAALQRFRALLEAEPA